MIRLLAIVALVCVVFLVVGIPRQTRRVRQAGGNARTPWISLLILAALAVWIAVPNLK